MGKIATAGLKDRATRHVRGDMHTSGIGSLRSILRQAHKSTSPKLSPKHLDRYVQKFATVTASAENARG